MKSFFDDSERNGNAGLRPHKALDTRLFIEKVIVTNLLSTPGLPKFLEFNTYSNMCLWELKKETARALKTNVLNLQFLRQHNKVAFKLCEHGKLLADLGVESYEEINVTRSTS